MSKKIKVGFIPVDGEVRAEYIEEEDGSIIKGIYKLIECRCIEAFSPVYGNQPLLWVDDEGVFTKSPNRAVYANEQMVQEGYISQATGEVVKKDELYTILFGNIVAVSYEYDENGEDIARDITDEELEQLKSDFDWIDSGMVEAIKLKMGWQ